MKQIYIQIFVIITIFIGCNNNSQTTNIEKNKQANIENDTKAGLNMIKQFYGQFYTKVDPDSENLKKKYVSERVLKRLDSLTSDGENLILDYDPFIKGQDYDANTIKKTLEISPLKNKNEYRVSFFLFGEKDEKRTYIDILSKKDKSGNFKIYSILNDEYLNFRSTHSANNISTKENYSITGDWKTDCTGSVASLNINGNTGFLEVISNQIYVELQEIKRYDFEKGIAYKLKNIPEDSGNFGATLPWKDYVNDKPIVYIKVVDDNTIKFYWYGFYNNKSKMRDITDCNFMQEVKKSKDNSVILKKCE